MEDKKTTDILGLAPYGEAINTAVTKSFEGVEGFLKLVCTPALEEVGLMFQDHVRHWRLNNILRIVEKSKGKLKFEEGKLQIKAHPRVALAIIESGSLNDNDEIQELWAGLFASSCTADGQDDENLIFVDLLKQLTIVEAKILKHCCLKTRKIVYPNELVVCENIELNYVDLIQISGIDNVHRLDRELDHLRSIELISGGFSLGGFEGSKDLIANVEPTALALNLYVRSQGFTGAITEYWKGEMITNEQQANERAAAGEKVKQEQIAKQRSVG